MLLALDEPLHISECPAPTIPNDNYISTNCTIHNQTNRESQTWEEIRKKEPGIT
jgi:hypothetical protein